jgi:Protein of unknown function (DUF1566)
VIAAWEGVWVAPAFAKNAFVEVTGQTTCYNFSSEVISCTDTGQDGDIQAGVPFPTPRFTDQRDGTVKDNLTNLIWLKDASCDALGPNGNGTATWQQAPDAANNLYDTRTPSTTDDCGLSDHSVAGDWRLPNVKELLSLIDFGFFAPALSNAAGTGIWTEGDAFLGVQSRDYWSSTTLADTPVYAWDVVLSVGSIVAVGKGGIFLVWPVRGGE